VIGWAAVRRQPIDAHTFDALKALADLRFRPSTVWELAPLSFVVDWFVSIGDTLRRTEGLATSTPEVELLASGYSTKVEVTGTCIVNPFASFPGTATLPGSVVGKYTSKVYTRQAEVILPTQPVAIPAPSLRLPNLGKIWTLTELILQFFITGVSTSKT
jgi:hypothetical protein